MTAEEQGLSDVELRLSVSSLRQGVGFLSQDVLAGNHADLTPEAVLEALAAVHDSIRSLRLLETALAGDLGKRIGKGKGDLADGRQYELTRTTDRKEWDHEEWKRDARRVLTQRMAERFTVSEVVDTSSGEIVTLGNVIQEAMAEIQNVQGSGPPKTTALKPLGLYASDYCTSTPGGWRFNAIEAKPETTTETSSGEQND